MTSREVGSGTVWVLTMVVLVWFLGGATLLAAVVTTERHRAAAAADLAALAAADRVLEGAGAACGTAAFVADAQGSRLVSCRVAGDAVTVLVERPTLGGWPGAGPARGLARAGPAGVPP